MPALVLTLGIGAVAAAAGPAAAVRTAFASTGGVNIVDPFESDEGEAVAILDNSAGNPFPSTISVSDSEVITDVDVQLLGLTHDFPSDIDMLLVGPGGQQVTLMSDAGGDVPITDVDVTLDDEAGSLLPAPEEITSGTYRPTDLGGDPDAFPSPAPTETGNTSLSVFDGTSTDGDWELYVRDDDFAKAGDLDGWRLSFRVASTPYPSQVTVSGLGSKVSDVNLTLKGLSHDYPDDLDLLLVGPGGQQSLLMSDVGGGDEVNGLDLTFDDQAPSGIADDASPTTGSYRPSDVVVPGFPDRFDAPAPALSGNTALSAFNGTNPNGVWSLYAVDDFADDNGILAGWSLDIETDNTPPTGSVAINGGAGSARSAAVTLNLAAGDPGAPTSGVTDVRLSNDGVTYSAFQPFTAVAPWTLTKGDGTKTVYVQFRDGSGNVSAAVSDTVVLDTAGPKAKRVKPKDGSKDAKVTAKVKVVASEALAPGSVTKRTVVLKQKGVGKVKAKVTYVAARHVIKLTPKSPLDPDATYVVKVRGVTDAAGNAWDQKPGKSGAQPLKFSFTTA